MKIRLLLLLSLLIASITVNAQQPGIVVNNSGDTLKCEMKFPFIGANKYKTAQMEDFKKLNVKEISYYRTDDLKHVYKAARLPNSKKTAFLQVVEEGRINLYTHTVTYSGYMGASYSTTTWYISKNNGELQELKTSALFSFKSKKDRKNNFSDMLADNPEALKLYQDEDNFSFKTLRNTVHFYNTGKPVEENKVAG
ncbi:hypothetical protein MUGA111182_20145 [Mucilaginibacter galii]|uniref:DUF4412 domain-containing protein n=1 Tax=Mucilaginibacter galii TaxID=2005073 RepID=A0A917JB52_9SPHI|nr:hypothetical protein [Mucilaginibacter galii]GGI50489.1 hypothetical protein GCM10011425_17010 [Mucilaginibacter galii]